MMSYVYHCWFKELQSIPQIMCMMMTTMEGNSWSDKMNDIGVMKPIISVVSRLLFVLSPSSPLLASLCFLYCGHVLQILKYLFFLGISSRSCFPQFAVLVKVCPSQPKFIYWAKLKICLAVSPAVSKWVMRDQKRPSLHCLFSWLYVSIFLQPFPMSNKLAILELILS